VFNSITVLYCLQRVLTFLLKNLLFFHSEVKSRRLFESKNNYGQNLNHCPSVCFHFSSEGEFEQIKYAMRELLNQGECLQLVFTSPSVESKVQKFAHQYPGQVDYIRLPLFNSSALYHWFRAKKLVLVRYDFFPSLLRLVSKTDVSLLYSATLKGRQSGLSYRFKLLALSQFKEIYAATSEDLLEIAKALRGRRIVGPLDLRCLEIRKRLDNIDEIALYPALTNFFETQKERRKIIFAQVWQEELDLFKKFNKSELSNLFIMVAPHLLSSENIHTIVTTLEENLPVPVYTIGKNFDEKEVIEIFAKYFENQGIIVSALPGLLCEMYSFFDDAYIGGGHGKGVHSIMEPMMSMCNIYCGPNTKRSTEYLVSQSLGFEIEIINNKENFFDIYNPDKENNTKELVDRFYQGNNEQFSSFIKMLSDNA
jgi:3-deoxy-D-manno-octulosonic-acid transferase